MLAGQEAAHSVNYLHKCNITGKNLALFPPTYSYSVIDGKEIASENENGLKSLFRHIIIQQTSPHECDDNGQKLSVENVGILAPSPLEANFSSQSLFYVMT